MSNGYFHRVSQQTPTRLWINNPTGAEADFALDAGAIACTTNPTYAAKLIRSEPEYIGPILDRATARHADDDDAADAVCREITARLIERFLPLYERSGGARGFVTIQSDPRKDEDTDAILAANRLYRALGPNFMAKVPVTAAGLAAIEALLAQDTPVCATEVFAVDQAVAVCELYQRTAARTGKRPPFFVTHITGIFDEYLQKQVARESVDIAPETLAWAGATVARKEWRLLKERGYPGTLLGGGARATRHFTDFVGGDFHITINADTAQTLIDADAPVDARFGTPTPPEVVAALRDRLPDFRRAYDEGGLPVDEFGAYGPVQLFRNNFIAGYERLLAEIAARRILHPGQTQLGVPNTTTTMNVAPPR